jgi:hypothetical protein
MHKKSFNFCFQMQINRLDSPPLLHNTFQDFRFQLSYCQEVNGCQFGHLNLLLILFLIIISKLLPLVSNHL